MPSSTTKSQPPRRRPAAVGRTGSPTTRDAATGDRWPLLWAIEDLAHEELAERLNTWDRARRTAAKRKREAVAILTDWLAAVNREPSAVIGNAGGAAIFALECLAATHLLHDASQHLPAELLRECLATLIAIAREVAVAQASDELLVDQLSAGELPLSIACLFPHVPERQELFTAAQQRLSQGVVGAVDGDGLPHRRHLPIARAILACWTRCDRLAQAASCEAFAGEAPLHFEWFVRRCLQLTRADGSQVLTTARSRAPTDDPHELFAAAVALAGDEDTAAIARLVLPPRKPAAKKSVNHELLPEAAAHSEWGQIAVLRPAWTREGEHLVVTYGDHSVHAELNWGGNVLWSGDWTPEITVAGRRAEVESDWEEVCWSSNDEVDYLELEASLSGGWRLQRQMLLAREDHFFFVGDAVLGPRPATVDYHCSLPLADSVGFYPADESHEGVLVTNGSRALVLPLALPEWRSALAPGSLATTGRGLQLSQQTTAARMYVPLFVDLKPKRAKLPFTWRRLTIGEKLQIVGNDEAVGYRVQIGGEQWLFYRSLAAPASRTILGQNLLHEFFAARFDCEGEAEELINVNPAH